MTETHIICPKCGAYSGDAWTQCAGICPMSMSPHFNDVCQAYWFEEYQVPEENSDIPFIAKEEWEEMK